MLQISRENLAERARGLPVLPLPLEDSPELVENRGIFGELLPGRLEDIVSLIELARLAIQIREGHVGNRGVLMSVHRALQNGHSLFELPSPSSARASKHDRLRLLAWRCCAPRTTSSASGNRLATR